MLLSLQDPADITRIEYNNTDDTITIFLPTSKVHRWSEVLSDGCSVNGSDLHCENLVDCSALIVKGWAMSKLTWRFKLTFFQSNRCFKVLHCACWEASEKEQFYLPWYACLMPSSQNCSTGDRKYILWNIWKETILFALIMPVQCHPVKTVAQVNCIWRWKIHIMEYLIWLIFHLKCRMDWWSKQIRRVCDKRVIDIVF